MNINSYFIEMLSPDSLKIAMPFLVEERKLIKRLLLDKSAKLLIAIGCGRGLYSDLAKYCKRYVGIDSLSDPDTAKKNIEFIASDFQQVQLNQAKGNKIISFLFNLASYINPNHIIEFINRNAITGDIVTISEWNDDKCSASIRKEYYKYIDNKIDDLLLVSKLQVKKIIKLNFKHINEYKYHSVIKNKYSKTTVIYL